MSSDSQLAAQSALAQLAAARSAQGGARRRRRYPMAQLQTRPMRPIGATPQATKQLHY